MIMSVLTSIAFSAAVFAGPAFPPASVEPVNPEGMCERFLKPTDQADCLKRAKTLDLDWYAAGVCDKVDDDDRFTACWKAIAGKEYEPRALAACAADGLADDPRIDCLKKAGTREALAAGGKTAPKRLPASKKDGRVYQPLEIKGR